MFKNTLIRLTSESNDGVFDGQYEPIIINPGAEIALQSASLSRSLEFLNIDATNDRVQFQISATNGLKEVFFDHGTYNRSNILDQLGLLQERMNRQLLNTDSKELGSQTNIRINQDEKVEVHFGFSGTNNYMKNNNPTIVYNNTNVVGSPKTLRSTGASTNDLHTNYSYGTLPFTKGAGYLRVRSNNMVTNAGGSGYTIGLVEGMEKIRDGTFRLADVKYGIRFPNNTTHAYRIIKDGIETANTGGLTPLKFLTATRTDNDVAHIELSGGVIRYIIYQDGLTTDITDNADGLEYDQNKDYFPFIAIHGDANDTKLDLAGYTHDPFFRTPDNFDINLHAVQLDETINELTAPANPRAVGRNTVYNLVFEAQDVAEYFGFNRTEQNRTAEATADGLYISNKKVDTILYTDTYLVELLSLNLDSYDSFKKGRKNLLSTIPVSERVISQTGVLQYEPNNLFYISLNNTHQLSLRNLRARVITDRYEPIIMEGLGSLSILIKSPKS